MFDNRTQNSSVQPATEMQFNLSAAVYGEPPTPAYLMGPAWLPEFIRKFWLPANQLTLWVAYAGVALIWVNLLKDAYLSYRSDGEFE